MAAKTCAEAKAALDAANAKLATDQAAQTAAAQAETAANAAKDAAVAAKKDIDKKVTEDQANVKRDQQHVKADAALVAEGGLGNSAANQQLNADYQHFLDQLGIDSGNLKTDTAAAATAAQAVKDTAAAALAATEARKALDQKVSDDKAAAQTAQDAVTKLCVPTGPLTAQGYVGQPFSFNIQSVPALAGYASYSAGVNYSGGPTGDPLPPGLKVDGVGMITGTPTKEGSTTVTIAAWNSLSVNMPGGVSRLFGSLTINIGPQIPQTSVTTAPFVGSPQDTTDLSFTSPNQGSPGAGTGAPTPIISSNSGQPPVAIVTGNSSNDTLTNLGNVGAPSPIFPTVPVPSFASADLGSANSASYGLPSNLINSNFSAGNIANGFAGTPSISTPFTNLGTGIIVLGSVSGDTFGSANVVSDSGGTET